MILNLIAKKYVNYLTKKKSDKKTQGQFKEFKLSKNLNDNLEKFKGLFSNSGDIKYHNFYFGEYTDQSCALIYIDGMVNGIKITEDIVKPMMTAGDKELPQNLTADYFLENALYTADAKVSSKVVELVDGCMAGDTILLINGIDEGLIIGTKGFDTRNITEPQTESVVRGPREGFTENFRTNTSLLRRKIKNPKLILENLKKGEKTKTDICLAYIDGVANKRTVELVKERIMRLNVDCILDAGFIEEYIEDYPLTIFPTIGYTEKPDVVAAKVLEGRIAVMVDGSPFVLTMPFLFNENFHTAEDYYTRPIAATIFRLLRYFTFFIAVFGVPVYIAFTTFHQELVPTTLLFTIADAREGTPFPAVIEALILILSFEILRESGLRLPRQVGQAISIVGALVMGEAAVSAGVVGAPMVIVVAIASVATFATPEIADVIGILRIILLFLASILGGFGVTMGMLGILIHLATLKSFGVEYFGLVNLTADSKDEIIRMPLWTMKTRPQNIAKDDTVKLKAFVPPEPAGKHSSESKNDEV